MPMPFDPERLYAALRDLPVDAWSLPSTWDATGVHHGYRRAVLATIKHPFGWVLDAFEPVANAWLSWIDPGGFIAPHVDGGPYLERWQVPISTAGVTVQHDLATPAVNGQPFRVEHWLPHSVSNPSDHPRVHLVIDRDVIANPALTPFQLTAREG